MTVSAVTFVCANTNLLTYLLTYLLEFSSERSGQAREFVVDNRFHTKVAATENDLSLIYGLVITETTANVKNFI